MSGMVCGKCGDLTNDAMPLHCDRVDCPQGPTPKLRPMFLHIKPKIDGCEHDFSEWRNDEDGRGGSLVCAKCGITAREVTMARSP